MTNTLSPPGVIAVFGPTSIGKTEIVIELAELLRKRGEVPVAVSADAMQVYGGMPIITGAASLEQQERLEHRMVGVVPIDCSYDVASYAESAHAEIDHLLSEGKRPIVVGGTGLYLRAALTELDFLPPPPPGARDRLERELSEQGSGTLHERLREADPDVAATLKPGDGRRIVRALEAFEQGSSAASRAENRLWTKETRHPTALFALVMDRAALYRKIEARIDEMIKAEAEQEVLAANNAGASLTARQALGFKELLDGDVTLMKTNTRRYAKRQLTWLRKLPLATTIDVTGRDASEVARAIEDCLVAPEH